MYSSKKDTECSAPEHDKRPGRRTPPDCSALSVYTKIFWGYREAAEQGYLSKSRWRKLKREPLPDAPKAMVVRETVKVHVIDGWSLFPVLKHLDPDTDLVAQRWWEVIHREHTVGIHSLNIDECQTNDLPQQALPLQGQPSSSVQQPHSLVDAFSQSQVSVSVSDSLPNVQQPDSSVKESFHSQVSVSVPSKYSLISHHSSHSHPTLITSIDRREVNETATSIEKTQGFTIINPHEYCLSRIGAFVPENFNKEDEQRLGEYAQEAFCIFHNMHLFRVRTRQPKDSWIDLSYDYCDKRFPNWRKLRPMLLDGILERTEVESFPELGIVVPRGVKGGRCYGYRFANEEYRNATVRKRAITNPDLIKMIESHRNVRYPVQRWLERNLKQVEIADVPEDTLLELALGEDDPAVRYHTYREQVDLVRDKAWVFVVDDFSRRVHTNLTALKRELRGYLRVAGSPLFQIDIKNSQPLFIGLAAARRYGIEDARYLGLCQQDLYKHLADLAGLHRDDAKKQLTQAALFAPNGSPNQRLPVKQIFDTEFPKIAEFIRGMKKGLRTTENPKPHNRLAKLAQQAEANFVIYGGVCDRIRQDRPDCWISTIHDSILTLPDSAEYVRGVMLEEFGKFGVQPRLEVEACDR